MEPLERLLASMESGEGAFPRERDLEFRVDPGKVRQALATLVKADPKLWFKHLLQLLYDVTLDGPITLKRLNGDRLGVHFAPLDPEVSRQLVPRQVHGARDRLMARSRDAFMARILCEVEGQVVYRHALDGGIALVSTPDDLLLQTATQSAPGQGVTLELPGRTLFPSPGLFANPSRAMLDSLQPLASLCPHRVELHTWQPLIPDWPFPASGGEDDDRPQLWDWESVLPAEDGGFRWDVSALAEPVINTDGQDFEILRHPMELKRAFATLPMLGCYPASLASRMSSRPDYGDRFRLSVRQVFGISWSASTSLRSELFPVLRGVAGEPIRLEGVPAGLYLLADASHLRTDATGLRLVRDDAATAWQDALLEWAREQTKLYLPFVPDIPRFWMSRVKRWEDLGRPAGPWKRVWQAAATALFSAAPVQGLSERRRRDLAGWAGGKD